VNRFSAAIRTMMVSFTIQEEDVEPIIEKTKTVLGAVRCIYWRTRTNADLIREEAANGLYADIGTALQYLSDFAPINEQKDHEQRILNIYENQTIIKMLESILKSIGDYPENGALYNTILKNYYFDDKRSSDERIYEELGIERTLYYQRKKEAVLLFGLQLRSFKPPPKTGKPRRAKSRNSLVST